MLIIKTVCCVVMDTDEGLNNYDKNLDKYNTHDNTIRLIITRSIHSPSVEQLHYNYKLNYDTLS